MCFVLDVNSFHCMFDPNSSNYADFKPLSQWLFKKRGTSLVIGGNHYLKELDKLKNKYVSFLAELERNRKISKIKNEIVDDEENRLKSIVNQKKFNDPHIVALFCVSGCLIFASHDKKADRFIKRRNLYPSGQRPPSIYRCAKHAKLLCDKNIVRLRNIK